MDLTALLKQIDAKKEQMGTYRPLSQADMRAIEHEKKIAHVWSSNAIEGNTLTLYETTSILETGMTVHEKPIKDVLEAIDLADAYDYMMDLVQHKQPVTETMIRDLNRFVTAKTTRDVQNAGAYRVEKAWPAGFPENAYPPPFEIRPAMADLVTWSRTNQARLHPVVYAAELHQRFVSIHPFIDGNGRTVRLLMNFALVENGLPLINIQPDKASRDTYMKALYTSQQIGEHGPFVRLVADYVDKELDERIKILQLNEKNLQDAALETNLPHRPK
ncbi:Fic family protein [Schleiferilactobacillus shenzhenensis]|uniref:Fido domain-containing protein n=1 Tax=Schleiferilactobacillus shenzhenensis LY-73 TaxID=1231336 RepID=U4TGM4_9LACO|nr:Fic family protein [Schleiferilactobacillus shenzhenensis]ERL63926.1 Uncharacterized protein L248_1745 [Schleiferilactobacillus shenzhenensis LY-73]